MPASTGSVMPDHPERGSEGPGLVVVGVSMGGLEALKRFLGSLPADFPMPVLVVQHLAPESGDGLATLLDTLCSIRVQEADAGVTPRPGTVYLAPANYHLLVEADGGLSLSVDPPVNFARPSVDVLFETAAEAFGARLVGVLLTGAGSDGSRGLLAIQRGGGRVLVQDPADATADSMPRSALDLLKPDAVLPLEGLAASLLGLAQNSARPIPGPTSHP
jgi:two-component system, chemotaxis family, protein-glutamate methylesterase/glutaminase